MKTKTVTGGLAAAAAMLSLSGAAIADHGASCAEGLRNMVIQHAKELACNHSVSYDTLGYSGAWPSTQPLWQFRAGKLKNATEEDRLAAYCGVHAKVASRLYVNFPDEDSPPPRNNKKKAAWGVANALDPVDPDFEEAIVKLEDFKELVDASDPNSDSTDFPGFSGNDNPTQADWEAQLKLWADITIGQVKACGHLL